MNNMNDMDNKTTDYRETSGHRKKNQRVWVYVFLGILLFAGIFVWESLSNSKENNTPLNSSTSSSNTSSIDNQKTDINRGSDSALPDVESRQD
ncbi:hypothetical protein [Nitrosomonas supralitoralis]|uniref:Uncharacterized protein n=1 Tax=Nitrosomonas supralitoralis TaxID=2116706 RepID=A0A2P7NQN2_9PROT|nr:hypothetical protein [Nitrosomonas supralitoralis]PSJ15781.1 hypothetical protein C7H79_17130 [Nitrosomonas supralitoralis]